MNFRKFGLAVVTSVSVFALAACGQSAKDVVIDTTKTLQEAKQLDTSTKIAIDLDTNVKDLFSVEDKEAIELLKGMALTVDSKVDKELKKEEATVGLKAELEGINVDVKLPILYDGKAEKLYFKADSISAFLNILELEDVAALEPLKGKIVELDAASAGVTDKEAEKLQKDAEKLLLDTLNSLPEKQFEKNKDTYTATITGKDFTKLVNDYIDLAAKLDETVDAATLKAQWKEASAEANLDKTKVVYEYVLDGKKVKEQNVKVELHVKDPESDEFMKITLKVNSKINSINKEVKFTINPTKSNIAPQADVENAFNELLTAFYYGGMYDDAEFEYEDGELDEEFYYDEEFDEEVVEDDAA